MTPRETTIVALLRESPMTLHELAYRLRLRKTYVRWRVDRLRKRGEVRVVRTLRESSVGHNPQNLWGIGSSQGAQGSGA